MNPEKFSTITAALLSSSAASLKQEVLKVATINDLFELANRVEDARICFKASWALEHILLSEKKLLLTYATPSIEAFLKNSNWSALRSITKLIMKLLSLNYPLTQEQEEMIINKTYDILEDSECPIAVRCNGYDILYYLSVKHYWLIDELKNKMQLDIEKNQSAALVSRSKSIYKKLKRISNS